MICPHCKNNTACEMPMSGLVCDTVGCNAYKAVKFNDQTLDPKDSTPLWHSTRIRHSPGPALQSDYMTKTHEAAVRPILDALPPGPQAVIFHWKDGSQTLFVKYV